MKLPSSVEGHVLSAAMALPASVQRLLCGGSVEADGQRLAPDIALLLKLQRLAREPGAETLPMDRGRAALRRHTGLVGGVQPIGAVRDLEVAGRRARLYTPTSPIEGALLVFFHGGGFMHGDLESHDAGCRFLAQTSGVTVLSVEYRLGPEHKLPAAHDDVVAAYAWVVDHAAELGADRDRIGVGGDSAGGNLAAWVALEAAHKGLPCRTQLLIYPCTVGRRETESGRMFNEGYYLTQGYMDLGTASYVSSEADLDDPRMTLAEAPIAGGAAKALVFTAGFDPLRDEGEAYAAHLESAGVQVDLHRFPDQIHGFFNTVGVGRSARHATRRVALALRSAMSD